MKWFKHTMIYPVQVGFKPSHAKEVISDICCPQKEGKYIKKQPNIAQKDPCRGQHARSVC